VSTLKVLVAVLAKDLRVELRSRAATISMLTMALLAVIVFQLAFAPSGREALRLGPGMLWVAFSFASILGLNRSLQLEREAGATVALLLAPVDRGAVYLGKALANALLLLLLQAVVWPCFAFLQNVSLAAALPRLLLIGALGSLGLAAAGTAFAAVAASTRMREVLTPLLVLPTATPVLVAAVEGSTQALAPGGGEVAPALRLLVGFALVYLSASYLVFGAILEE
jgi:heme exporter protein B